MIVAALLAGFFAMVFFSLMFAGAEQAVGSISKDSLENMVGDGVYGAGLILKVAGNRRRFQLMLVSGKIVSIVIGAVLLALFLGRLIGGDGLIRWDAALLAIATSSAVFLMTEGVLSRVVSVGEHEAAVSRFALFLAVFHVLFFPLTASMDIILSLFIKRNTEMAAKEEALKEFVKSESESGVIEEEEGEMIQSVLSFYDTTSREIMTPRIDVVAADAAISLPDFIDLLKKEGHSRIPIYEDRIDNILGVVYSKDLLIAIAERGRENVSIAETMRKPYFIPETKRISELLDELRKLKVHLAIVVDEYGGTSGIVALEDILEEIVGDIQDEYDEDEGDYSWIDNRTVIMDAGLNIEDVNDVLRTHIPNEDFDTLGGFIYHQLGFIPEGGEELVWGDVSFCIAEIIGNRISKVRVALPEPRSENEHSQA